MNRLSRDGDASRKPLTLLHTSDLHIGSDVYFEEALRGLDAVLSKGRQASVDALLIAGDLFDDQRVPADVVDYVFQALASLECPVIILPGNHDTLIMSSSPSLHRLPASFWVLQAPAGELVTITNLDLSVWGRPVYNHEPTFHPLAGLPPRTHEGWYVAMGHGLIMDGNADQGRSSPIRVEDLAQADCDYIALGHIHQFRDVTQGHTPAFYSGAPSGTQRPTVALVTLNPAEGVSVRAARLY